MKRFTLTISLHQYWHCGTGSGGEGDVDATPEVEPCGLPMIPGKHLKGLLREAARFACQEGFMDDADLVMRWFGQRDDTKGQQAGRIHVSNGICRDDFANYARGFHQAKGHSCPEVAAMFETLRQTALKDGVAKNKTLRSIRCTVPTTMQAEVEIEGEEQDAESTLKVLCQLIRSVGHGKNDGLGRCEVTCCVAEDDSVVAATARHESDVLSRLVEFTLLDDVIVSAGSASAGAHRCLDYIPGSALLGIAAGKLYATLKAQGRAIAIFQSGGVSFGNAYPVSESATEMSLPIPSSWHTGKQNADSVCDLSANPNALGATQPKQMRGGYLQGHQVLKPGTGYRMKTAISHESGTAEDAKLFGFSYLPAGSRFIARLTARQVTDLADVSAVFDNTIVRIGRSRRNEFGRAKARLLIDATKSTSPIAAKRLSILAESDLALVDEAGFPTTSHEGIIKALGLPEGWEIIKECTFLRRRRYSVWNAVRQSFDPERYVITKGSVITVEGGSDFTPQVQSIGLYQGEGLGRILWQIPSVPENLTTFQQMIDGGNTPALPKHKVVQRHQRGRLDAEALTLAQQWSRDWLGYRASLGSSQWSRLREAASRAELATSLADSLNSDNGIFRHGKMAEKWKKEKGRNHTLAADILTCLRDQTKSEALRLAACREAARLCAAAASQSKEKSPA